MTAWDGLSDARAWAGKPQIGSTAAAMARPVISPPIHGAFGDRRGCKVGKIPRFLSSELITF
jgi:hypothetical protein